MSPAGGGLYSQYLVKVTVNGAPFTFVENPFQFDGPNVTAVAPDHFPTEVVDQHMVITGVSFGVLLGSVRVGGAPTECMAWNDTAIECAVPSGVLENAAVVVTAASGLASVSLWMGWVRCFAWLECRYYRW